MTIPWSKMIEPQREFMEAAIKEGEVAKELGDYPIGAVIVRSNEIISGSPARAKADSDPTQHAEVAAIRLATKRLGTRYLEGCVLYTTHEPCPMCSAAAVWAKLMGIVYGATREDMKNSGWRMIDLPSASVLEKADPQLFLIKEFMREECKNLSV